MHWLWRKTSRNRLVILFSCLAACAYCIPLQRYFTMGRYQHYGLAIGLFGLGYLLQTIWSWKIFTHWARMAYLSTGLFSLTVGLTFFYNPWLDSKMAPQTQATDQRRPILMSLYLLLSFYVGSIYARWIREEHKARLEAESAAMAKTGNIEKKVEISESREAGAGIAAVSADLNKTESKANPTAEFERSSEKDNGGNTGKIENGLQ